MGMPAHRTDWTVAMVNALHDDGKRYDRPLIPTSGTSMEAVRARERRSTIRREEPISG
jgi:hypothetical protein